MEKAMPWLIAGSTAMSMFEQGMAGDIADQAGKTRAAQLRQSADAAYARGTREAAEIRRQGNKLKSDAAAAMAAGGGVTDDAGAITTMADIEQVANYNALSALFEGETQAQQANYAADLAKWQGRQSKKMSRFGMGGTALGGYAKYIDWKTR